MNQETGDAYSKPLGLWDEAMREYYCAEVILDQIDNCMPQVAHHLMRAWQRLALAEASERGESVEGETVPLEIVKGLLPNELFSGVRRKDRPRWEETLKSIFEIGAASCKSVREPQSTLRDSSLRDQVYWTGLVLRTYRRRLDRKYKMRLGDRLLRRRKQLAIGITLFITVVYIGLSLKLDSFNPRYWGIRRYNGFGIISAKQEWATLNLGLSVDGRPLSIAGQAFATGLGTHANSTIEVFLPEGGATLSGACGVADEVGKEGSVVCQIKDGGTLLYESPLLKGGDKAAPFSIPVEDRRRLTFLVTDGGDNIGFDHANWVDLTLH